MRGGYRHGDNVGCPTSAQPDRGNPASDDEARVHGGSLMVESLDRNITLYARDYDCGQGLQIQRRDHENGLGHSWDAAECVG